MEFPIDKYGLRTLTRGSIRVSIVDNRRDAATHAEHWLVIVTNEEYHKVVTAGFSGFYAAQHAAKRALSTAGIWAIWLENADLTNATTVMYLQETIKA